MLMAKCWRQSQDIEINVCLHKYLKHLSMHMLKKGQREEERMGGKGKERKEGCKIWDFAELKSRSVCLKSHLVPMPCFVINQ